MEKKKKVSNGESKHKGVVGRPRKYSRVEIDAAKLTYLMMGKDRSLEVIAKYSGIDKTTLYDYAKAEDWYSWVKEEEVALERLALRGMYDIGVLYLRNKATVILSKIIDKGSELIDGDVLSIKGNDVTGAAKMILDLEDANGSSKDEKLPAWSVDESEELQGDDDDAAG